MLASASSTFGVRAASWSFKSGAAPATWAFCERDRHWLTSVSLAATADRIARDWATMGLAPLACGFGASEVRFAPFSSCLADSVAAGALLIFKVYCPGFRPVTFNVY